MKRRIHVSFLALACLAGCAPAFDRSYEEALTRQATVTDMTVEHRALTQEELAHQEEERKRLAALPSSSATILVTTGPISQPYEALGEVHANTVGMINFGSILTDAFFRSPLATSVQKTPTANMEQMNHLLRDRARQQYRSRVDAVINVTYRTDPDGDVFASGLAVHFTPPPSPSAPAAPVRSAEERLNEIRRLLDQGLITQGEYERKRAEILNEL